MTPLLYWKILFATWKWALILLQAALIGSREIGFTVLSMTLSLVAVFIPVLLMPGIVGRIFFEFAVTISVAILISGFISLSLTPMLCSKWLRKQTTGAYQ